MKRKRIYSVLVPLLMLVGSGIGLAQQEMLDLRTGPARERTILLPPDEFTLPRLIGLSEEFLAATVDAPMLRKLTIATTKREIRQSILPSQPTEYSYGAWRSQFEREKVERGPFAQLIATRNGATLRVQDRDGTLSSHVIPQYENTTG